MARVAPARMNAALHCNHRHVARESLDRAPDCREVHTLDVDVRKAEPFARKTHREELVYRDHVGHVGYLCPLGLRALCCHPMTLEGKPRGGPWTSMLNVCWDRDARGMLAYPGVHWHNVGHGRGVALSDGSHVLFYRVEAVHHPMRCGGREVARLHPVVSSRIKHGAGRYEVLREKADEECNKNGLTARRAQCPCAISVTVWP
mmetsp:Transcript_11243/g.26701  ORF Transcript_11243/g.26701 Transcript_11243/m.26701 type:complete len:203 (+) Transcript_11243:357-965(+)